MTSAAVLLGCLFMQYECQLTSSSSFEVVSPSFVVKFVAYTSFRKIVTLLVSIINDITMCALWPDNHLVLQPADHMKLTSYTGQTIFVLDQLYVVK